MADKKAMPDPDTYNKNVVDPYNASHPGEKQMLHMLPNKLHPKLGNNLGTPEHAVHELTSPMAPRQSKTFVDNSTEGITSDPAL